MICQDEHIVAACERGNMHIFSTTRNKYCTLEGAGSATPWRIAVKNNQLYQSSLTGIKKGILIYDMDLSRIDWSSSDNTTT